MVSIIADKKERMLKFNANELKNSAARSALKHQQELVKSKQREHRKNERKKEHIVLKPKTLESLREKDVTVVDRASMNEIQGEEEMDEFSSFFRGEVTPKIMMTTQAHPGKKVLEFITDLLYLFPNSFYYSRRDYQLKQIVEYAKNKEFTDVMVFSQRRNEVNGMILIHLPEGPTAYFRISGIKRCSQLQDLAAPSKHNPELILNNFNTRLGHRMARMVTALFPHDPEFTGRRVVTFHNQRDFIFVRHHRYQFENKKAASIQEIGPEFTLRLKKLQLGTFDSLFGQYEWFHKNEMDTSRRRFFM